MAVDEETARYRRAYDTDLSALLSDIWEGNLHIGVFKDLTEPLKDAHLLAKALLASVLRLTHNAHVLEVACGIGGTARYLARHHHCRVTATNIAVRQIEEAQGLTAAQGLADRVEFAYADYHDLPFPDGSFDAWICQEALLYSVDKPRVFAEARRVLRPGARLVFTDLTIGPNVPSGARAEFARTIRAPGLWSSAQWDSLLAGLSGASLAREDWSRHVAPTFSCVSRNLDACAQAYSKRLGADIVAGTIERVSAQRDAAVRGDLGCIFAALEFPNR